MKFSLNIQKIWGFGKKWCLELTITDSPFNHAQHKSPTLNILEVHFSINLYSRYVALWYTHFKICQQRYTQWFYCICTLEPIWDIDLRTILMNESYTFLLRTVNANIIVKIFMKSVSRRLKWRNCLSCHLAIRRRGEKKTKLFLRAWLTQILHFWENSCHGHFGIKARGNSHSALV